MLKRDMVSKGKKAVIDIMFVGICAGVPVGIMDIFSKRVGPGYVTTVTRSAGQAVNVKAVLYSLDILAQPERLKKLTHISSPITAASVQRQ